MSLEGTQNKANIDHPEDLTLARLAASGDEIGKRKFVERVLDRVAATARYIAGDGPDTDDYIQMSVIKVLNAAGSFRGESSLSTWSQRITARTVMREIKKNRWRGQFMAPDAQAEESSSEWMSGDRELTRRRMSQRLAQVLWSLSPKRRYVVTLRLVMGYGIDEIAEITGLKVNTVRDRIAVGRRKLRKQIAADPFLKEYVNAFEKG